MSKLTIRKHVVSPIPGDVANATWTLKRTGTPTPHKAWRWVRLANDFFPKTINLVDESWPVGTTTFSSPYLNNDPIYGPDNVLLAASNAEYFRNDGAPTYLGVMNASGIVVEHYSITNESGWSGTYDLEYSDDTTDGADGTWIKSDVGMTTTSTAESYVPVASRTDLSVYISDSLGRYHAELPSKAALSTIIQEIRAKNDHILRVADIDSRDILGGPATSNQIFYVEDTTDDVETIGSRAMYYIYFAATGTYRHYLTPTAAYGLIDSEW